MVDHVDVRGPSVLDIVTSVAGESPLAGTEKVYSGLVADQGLGDQTG